MCDPQTLQIWINCIAVSRHNNNWLFGWVYIHPFPLSYALWPTKGCLRSPFNLSNDLVCSHRLSCIFRHFYDTYVSLYNFVTWHIVYLFILRTTEILEAYETMFFITISLLHWNKSEINVYLFLFSNNHEKRTTSWSQCLLYGFIKSINPRRLLVYYNHTTAHVLCREMVLNGTSSKEHKNLQWKNRLLLKERKKNKCIQCDV